MEISMDKQYRTRCGHSVRIICTNKQGGHPVIGLVSSGNSDESAEFFTSEGDHDISDWSLVEVTPYDGYQIDDPVMVRDHDDQEWNRRHFAGVSPEGLAVTWSWGKTSWTARRPDERENWSECRRPTEEELQQ